ncbi:unnamed protein product [Blepharisma stoltei]|uniref:Uncharacterized protein n=1 Tax=Blepharisma stoltei TaxID=1481888 RepID=A0AAU9JE25_9CILI|nr:unnamed protein product [Blepharisma stoltei]
MFQNELAKVKLHKKEELSQEKSIARLIKFLSANEKSPLKNYHWKSPKALSKPPMNLQTLNDKGVALPSLRSIVKHKLFDANYQSPTFLLNKVSSMPDFRKFKLKTKKSLNAAEFENYTIRPQLSLKSKNKPKCSKQKFNPKLCILGNTKPFSINEASKLENSDAFTQPIRGNINNFQITPTIMKSQDFVFQPELDMVPLSTKSESLKKIKEVKKYSRKLKLESLSYNSKPKFRSIQVETDFQDLHGWADSSSLSKSR